MTVTALSDALTKKAKELLDQKKVDRVVGWTKGEFAYDHSPAVFESSAELSDFVYDDFCGANLSKYLITQSKKQGKTAVFLKPCDTYSFNQLVKENRINRDDVLVIGVECQGKIDDFKTEKCGIIGVTGERYDGNDVIFDTVDGVKTAKKHDVLLEKCLTCKSKKFAVSDETIVLQDMQESDLDRFGKVKELEGMLASENIKDKTATAVPSDTRREQGGQDFDGFFGEPLKTSAKFVKEGGVYEPVVTKPKTITEAGNYASQMFLLNKQGE